MTLSTRIHSALWTPAIAVAMLSASAAAAIAQTRIYSPIPLPNSREVQDTLSDQDIPTGVGGYARDYTVYLEAGDQVAIDLISDEFDTLVSLIGPNGATISENDDGPDGTTNSLLFARITTTGVYTVRVRAYAGQGTGTFTLKVARLRPVN